MLRGAILGLLILSSRLLQIMGPSGPCEQRFYRCITNNKWNVGKSLWDLSKHINRDSNRKGLDLPGSRCDIKMCAWIRCLWRHDGEEPIVVGNWTYALTWTHKMLIGWWSYCIFDVVSHYEGVTPRSSAVYRSVRRGFELRASSYRHSTQNPSGSLSPNIAGCSMWCRN